MKRSVACAIVVLLLVVTGNSAQPGFSAGAQGSGSAPTLHYVAGSTMKLEQLIGDTDKQRHQPTLSQTAKRYGLIGTDLGNSFEHAGRVYFLFGDTVGHWGHALDSIGTTDVTDPEPGVRLDFLTDGQYYLTIQPPGISMGAFEVPVAGIDLGGQTYVAVSTNHSADRSTDRSVLTKFTAPKTFQPLRTISQLPAGRFVKMSMHAQPAPGPMAGLPSGGPYVLVWGTGVYRKSDAYLSIVPVATFETGNGTRYFAGLDASGAPTWSDRESDAKAIVSNGTLGDLSVTWCRDLGVWLMNYDSRDPKGLLFSYSRTPWGPWRQPQALFTSADGLGKFIHKAGSKDGLAGPVIGQGTSHPEGVEGGIYAPYVVERWTKRVGTELDLYYVMSTWNPYTVVLMKSRFTVQ